MPINQVATVSVPEPRMISVSVWDKSMVGPVDRAIREANLGLNPIVDGTTLRIPLPELNEQRRKELVKIAHGYAENARVAVRHVRRDGMDHLKKAEKDGDISQDERRLQADRVQKMTDETISPGRRPARREGSRDHAGLTCIRRGFAHSTHGTDAGERKRDDEHAGHVAIIMDGNGRWAKARGLPRVAGHRAGVEALRETVRAAGDLGIPVSRSMPSPRKTGRGRRPESAT